MAALPVLGATSFLTLVGAMFRLQLQRSLPLRLAAGPAGPIRRAQPRAQRASTAAAAKACLVVGGSGALGRAAVTGFSRAGWHCTSVDFSANDEAAGGTVLLREGEAFADSSRRVLEELRAASGGGFGAVVHAGGGWAGSDPGDDGFPESLEFLWDVNVKSAALAAHVAGDMLLPGGTLTLTGAAAAVGDGGTAGMAAYGMTKAATHHLMDSMRNTLQDGASVHTILPMTIATPANIEAMPDADTSSWTDPADIATAVVGWAEGKSPPANGAYVEMTTEGGSTSFTY